MFAFKDFASKSPVYSSRRLLGGALLLALSTGLLRGADSWQARAPVPGARAAHSAVWTGREMIVWGGGIDGQFLGTGARYHPATDHWVPTSLRDAPSPRWFHAAVWTGGEMIVWGGRANFAGVNNFNDGGRYDPATDTWTPISTQGAPSPRSQCAAVWTGSEMIIWGGATEDGIELNDGARYNPESDAWSPISNASGLQPRMEPTGLWTGEELIVFGGMKFTGGQLSFGDGARYHPANNSWTALPDLNGPGSRTGHTATWTGERMVVWGGYRVPDQVAVNTGASYDPGANRWTPLPMGGAPTARFYHAAVWTGTEMLVWGGQDIAGTMLNTGARYKPALQSWAATTQTGAPGKRQFWRPDLGIWTGSGMLICAGSDYPASLDSTAIYFTGASAPPSGTDILIRFDPPSLPGGSRLIESWTEQGFRFVTGSGRMAHTDSGVSTNFPGNGGAYLQFGFGQQPLIIANLSGQAFALKQVDLAEYSTGFPVPKTITFTGYYADGSAVVQSFTTDGVIDGRGPVRDFETFAFSSSFAGLVRLEVTPYAYSLDNLLVSVATNLPPPPPAPGYDVSRDYSTIDNPAGPWSYGWKESLDGGFTRITYAKHLAAENGVPIFAWQLTLDELPSVAYVVGPGTAVSAGGQFVAEPGTLYFTAGADGTPYNFGAIRFTVPPGQGGNYRLETSVRDLFDGSFQGDTDFHVVRNGVELFGRLIPVHTTAGYSNVLALAEGDSIELLVGRGQDGHQAGSGLKLLARLTSVTNAPPPPPPPPPPPVTFDLSRDFSPTVNPGGIWSYGWLEELSGPFHPLSFPKSFYSDNGQPISAWQVTDDLAPGIYRHMGDGLAVSAGGAFTAPPGTMWFWPGNDGTPRNFGVIRFRVPAGRAGHYRIETSVHSLFDGPISKDSEFHVTRNGEELFGRFVGPNSGTGYSNTISLVAGDTIDFAVGRGEDGSVEHSGLKIAAALTLVTNLPPPPPPALAFDLSRDYSLAANPNGPWSYGSLTALDGTFGLLGAARTFGADNGVPIGVWELNTYQLPIVAKVLGPGTAHSDGDHFTAEPGTIYFAPGADGAPQNFGAIRFTVPAGAGGQYRIATSVRSLFDGGRSRDADFHVLRNGQELFGEFLPPNSGTQYSNVVTLAPGDRLDFAIGRGADGTTFDTGLKIQATLTPLNLVTNPPPPAPFYDLSRDFSPTHNPAGAWSFGHETTLGGTFTLLTFPLTSFADNPVPVNSWSKNGYEPVAVYHNGTTNTSISDGGAGVFPPGTTWFYPGIEGHTDNYGVIRFTVPARGAGTYQLHTEVRAYLDGPRSGDTDFHVLRNGVELFGQFVPGNSGTAYSNRLSLVEGDTIDFAVGRGRDDIAFDSGLKIRASIALVSAPPPPPPPPPAMSFDLSRDYSLAANPNGPWSYGYLTDLDGSLGLLGASRTFSADNGVPIAAWELTTYQLPGVWKVMGPGVAHSDGDHFTAEPGTVYFAPGADGAPHDFGVIRFTVPPEAGGQYRLATSVRSLFDGGRSRDADFHVLKNGQEMFGEFLPPNSGTSYSNVLALAPGDRLDFAIGRGADGLTADTGLKIGATLVRLTLPPPPTQCAPAPASAVAWWPAEGNANDVVGTNSGTLFGGAGYSTGRVARAFAFPGGDSGLKFPAGPGLDVGSGGGLTIEGWINPADLSLRGPLVEWNRGGTGIIEWGVHLYILRPDEFSLGAGNLFANLAESNGQPHFLMAPGGTVQANTWQHIALTYDKASGEARLYRNGEVVASENLGTFEPETSYDLYLGRRPAGDAALSYHGLLDEFAIYDRGLDAGEVAAIAAAGRSGKCRIPAALDELADLVPGLTVPVETQPLLASLEAVRASILRGNLLAAINQLQAFQNQVRSQIAPLDEALAEELSNLAQQVIETLDPTGVRRVTFVAAAETPLRLDRCVLTPTGATCVEGSGAAGATCCVQRSTNLADWEPIGCATEIDDGRFEFIDANPPAGATRFYRLYAP